MSDDCLFCRIASGELDADILYQDAEVTAFRDVNPQAPTHILVIPNRHIASVAEATAADVGVLGKLMLAARELAGKEGLDDSGYRMVVNTGSGAGQTVFHIHLHLLGGRAFSWPPG